MIYQLFESLINIRYITNIFLWQQQSRLYQYFRQNLQSNQRPTKQKFSSNVNNIGQQADLAGSFVSIHGIIQSYQNWIHNYSTVAKIIRRRRQNQEIISHFMKNEIELQYQQTYYSKVLMIKEDIRIQKTRQYISQEKKIKQKQICILEYEFLTVIVEEICLLLFISGCLFQTSKNLLHFLFNMAMRLSPTNDSVCAPNTHHEAQYKVLVLSSQKSLRKIVMGASVSHQTKSPKENINLDIRSIKFTFQKQKKMCLSVWSSINHENDKYEMKLSFKNVDACFLVYSPDNFASFQALQSYYFQIKEYCNDSIEDQLIKKTKRVQQQDILEFIKDKNIKLCERKECTLQNYLCQIFKQAVHQIISLSEENEYFNKLHMSIKTNTPHLEEMNDSNLYQEINFEQYQPKEDQKLSLLTQLKATQVQQGHRPNCCSK